MASTIRGSDNFTTDPAARAVVQVRTASGYGTTNNRIRRWTTVVSTVGTDITYADSATLGGTFTINVAGTYAITYTDQFTSADITTITLNDTAPAGIPQGADILAGAQGPVNGPGCAAWTGPLLAGAVIRARSYNGAGSGSVPIYGQFTIARVA